MSSFAPATSTKSALRLLIAGTAKTGKSLTSLHVARAIAGPDDAPDKYRIAVLDSEGRSALKYAVNGDEPEDPTNGRFRFLHTTVGGDDAGPGHHPEHWVNLMLEAERLGVRVVILDSASHEWVGRKGVLQIKDESTGRNEFSGWATASPLHQRFIDHILRTKLHVIATYRMKTEWMMQPQVDARGNTKLIPVKVGMGLVARDGTEYEFDLITEINREHVLHVEGARGAFSILEGRDYDHPSLDTFGADLAALLHGGRERYLATRPQAAAERADAPHAETLADA